MKVLSRHQTQNSYMKVFHQDNHVREWWDHSLMETSTVLQENMDIVIEDLVHVFVILDMLVLIVRSALILTSQWVRCALRKSFVQMTAVVLVFVTSTMAHVHVFLIELALNVKLYYVVFTTLCVRPAQRSNASSARPDTT